MFIKTGSVYWLSLPFSMVTYEADKAISKEKRSGVSAVVQISTDYLLVQVHGDPYMWGSCSSLSALS